MGGCVWKSASPPSLTPPFLLFVLSFLNKTKKRKNATPTPTPTLPKSLMFLKTTLLTSRVDEVKGVLYEFLSSIYIYKSFVSRCIEFVCIEFRLFPTTLSEKRQCQNASRLTTFFKLFENILTNVSLQPSMVIFKMLSF